MDGEYQDYYGPSSGDAAKLRDLEEKQRILKDRLILIGENLVELKEETSGKFLEIKKELQILKTNMERMISFIESFSSEMENFARKDDVEILSKQAKMFQPLELIKRR
ncbi:MAG: hypothetical protein AABX48_02710 [Nanoarchaeota archaeon]